jgi:hypothetical protein
MLRLALVLLVVAPGCSGKERGQQGASAGVTADGARSEGATSGDEPAGEPADEPADEPAADVPLEPLSLGRAGIAATVLAPAGATVDSRFLSAHVTAADREFAIVVERTGRTGRTESSMAERKRVIAENDENKLVRYLVEEPDALLYESRYAGQSEFHVLVHQDLQGIAYQCQDRKDTRFSLARARTMLRACRGLAAEHAEPRRPGGAP